MTVESDSFQAGDLVLVKLGFNEWCTSRIVSRHNNKGYLCSVPGRPDVVVKNNRIHVLPTDVEPMTKIMDNAAAKEFNNAAWATR